jgi:hypothetical protein
MPFGGSLCPLIGASRGWGSIMRTLFYRPLALSAVSLLALFGLSSAPGTAGASPSPPSVVGSIGTSVAAKSLVTKSLATAPITLPAPPPLPSGTKQACATPTKIDQEMCMLFLRAASSATKSAAVPGQAPVTGAYAPTDLQSAYSLASVSGINSPTPGTGPTVAIVDAYADPNLASDLATYRSQYNLGTCGTTSGCLTILNENGGTTLPTATDPKGGWEAEQAADVEMVSAICPDCKILMVEANTSGLIDLGTAENTAAGLAKFVSNSWGAPFIDQPGESFYDVGSPNSGFSGYFNHPGVAITFAAGDFGYGPAYPASSQLVTSVGGTYLLKANSTTRGWTETVWDNQGMSGATQSGCSAGEAKPSWQTDPGCANRTQNDVSAVASGPDGVSVYDSFDSCAKTGTVGWCAGFGTSIAAPIIAAVYALAGTPTPHTYPASYLYQGGQPANLYPVTAGSNGGCEGSRSYLCNAAGSLSSGYNGPGGWGTPNGITQFKNNLTTNIVSVYNPGAIDIESGVTYTQIAQLSAIDSAAGQTLTYRQSGLPVGLSMTTSGFISGDTTAVGTHTVKVTVTDTSGASSTISFVIGIAPSLESVYPNHPGTGPVRLDWGGKCLDDANNSSNDGTKIQIWTCDGKASQNWTYYPYPDPGDFGELTINGKCLGIAGGATANKSKLVLWACNGTANQQWLIAGFDGELINPISDKCIDDPFNSTTNGTQLDIYACNGEPWQAWTPPASPVLSGIGGKCMDDTGNSKTNGNLVKLYACSGVASQRWTVGLNGSLQINGKCLDASGFGTVDGTKVQLWSCTGHTNQDWIVTSFGMLENANAEKCLADQGNSATNGTQLVLEDCYGDQGEIWAET